MQRLTCLASSGFDVAELVEDISKYTPVPIPYSKPLPWGLIVTVAVSLIGAGVVAPYVLPLLTNRWTWAVGSIYFILIMVGGQMFVRIRSSPYVYPSKSGVSWIVQGYQNQLGAEVHAVAAAYGLLAFAFVALNSLITRVPSPSRQRTGVILWSTVLMVGFSGMLALFRVKNPSESLPLHTSDLRHTDYPVRLPVPRDVLVVGNHSEPIGWNYFVNSQVASFRPGSSTRQALENTKFAVLQGLTKRGSNATYGVLAKLTKERERGFHLFIVPF